MKSLKNHFSVILSLFVLLFSLQFSIMMDKIIKIKNRTLIENYSIVVVSKKKLNLAKVQAKIPHVVSLTPISSKKILDRLKNDMSSKNLALLKIALPYFYSLKLDILPTSKKIEEIKKTLLKIDGITKVETFAKTHSQIFRMFEIFQIMTYLFSVIIILISILLLFKQIRIWILEHEKKIKIMGYFGASFWMKSSFLYKLVLIDSVISAFLVTLLFSIAPKLGIVKQKTELIGISLPKFDIFKDAGILFTFSLFLSLFIVTLVAKKMDSK